MIMKVARIGNPIVRTEAAPVAAQELRSEAFQRLIDDMIETMREYSGVGLAATQVHVAKRVAVLEVAHTHPRYPDAPLIPLEVLVNPEILEYSEETESDWEGCLSVPDLRGSVPRSLRLKVRALDRDGRERVYTPENFHARIIQHEFDHLNGGVYLDRMTDLKSLSFTDEFQRYVMSS